MAVLSTLAFIQKWEARFADNSFQDITEEDFRDFTTDLNDSFVSVKELNVKMVRGATYPVPFTDNLGLIPPAYRILGMQAMARVGTDSGTAAVLNPALLPGPKYYQLIRDSAGSVEALLDEDPATVLTTPARWVLISGSEEERMDSFPPFVEEDRDPFYQPGDRFSYTFPSNLRRLFEVKVAQGYQAALPTGEENDPNYAPFAPLVASTGGASTFAELQGDPLDNGQLDVLFAGKEDTGNKGAANGYAPLVNSVVPAVHLPAYVDDVLEFATLAAFPAVGEPNKIYLALNDLDGQWRWTGSAYRKFNSAIGTTDNLVEGNVNKYFTDARAAAAAAALLVAGVTGSLVATFNSGTGVLTWNVKPASLNLTHLDPTVLALPAFTVAQKTAVANTANWSAKEYIGSESMLTVLDGAKYANADYLFEAVGDGYIVRTQRV